MELEGLDGALRREGPKRAAAHLSTPLAVVQRLVGRAVTTSPGVFDGAVATASTAGAGRTDPG